MYRVDDPQPESLSLQWVRFAIDWGWDVSYLFLDRVNKYVEGSHVSVHDVLFVGVVKGGHELAEVETNILGA